jgi:hypothetical protein
MADVSSLSWDDDLGDIDEGVTEDEIKDAEAMGKVAVGKYLCECVDSQPKQKDFKDYSCIAAGLRWEIRKVLELNGKAVEGDEGEAYEGRAIFDDVALYSPLEKDGMRKRRILIAKRTGLIGGSTDKITKKMWQKDIIGKKVIIEHIEESYTPKGSTVEKKIRKVAFDGYDSADGLNITDNTPEIDDI